MKKGLIVVAVIVVLALIFGGSLVGTRNELITERETVRATYQQVEVALQRRNDLIPNLVETVKGFAAQEKSVIDSVTSARAAMMGAKTPAETDAANRQVESALGRLFVVVENYPELKSNENFQRLQDELSGTENRIAVERRRYNEAVQKFNTDIQQFPANIAASIFGLSREETYFTADEGAKTVPKVNFGK